MQIHRGVVIGTRSLSPTLVRVTLGGDGVADFVSTGIGDEYVRLFLPHGDDRADVSLPVPDGDWWSTPEGQPEAPMRTYTIAGVRGTGAGVELDIDFVVHEAGVAGPWAVRAQPGNVLGLNSPTGLYAPPTGITWQVLVADLTGVPAVSRLIADAPAGVRTKVVLEMPTDAERPPLPSRDDVEITWVTGGNGHGPSMAGEIVRSAVPATLDFASGYVWVAGETTALRDVRRYLRRELGLPATAYKVVGYWTPIADWDARWQGLAEEVRAELTAMWDDPDADQEELIIDYEERLAQLGL